MAQTKEQKNKILENLKEKIGLQKVVLFVDLAGLKVKDLSILRKKLTQIESKLMVAKKTLAKIAFKDKGIEIDTKKLQGEIGFVFGFKDEILPAKTVYDFAKNSKNLTIVGGLFQNKLIGSEEMITLAQLPSKEELLGRMVRSIANPISGLLNVFQGNIKGLIYALSAIKK